MATEIGTNITAETENEGKTLVLRIDLTKQYGLTSSGKGTKVASSNGNVAVPGNEAIKLGLNVYRPNR